MTEQKNNKNKEHRHIEYNDMPGLVRILVIKKITEKQAINIGTALFIYNDKFAIMWDIFVDPQYRRQGYALNILEAAKKMWNEIRTGWRTIEGKNLCLKVGFKDHGDPTLGLVWEKK